MEEGSFHGFSAECWKRYIHFACHSIEPNLFKRFANRCILDGFLKIYQEICGYILKSFIITASNQSQPSLTCFRNKFDAPLRRGVASNIDASRCRLPGPYRFRLIKSVLHEQRIGFRVVAHASTFRDFECIYRYTVRIYIYILLRLCYIIYINVPMWVCLVLDQEGLIVVTRNSAFICRVSATNYNIAPWLSLQWPRRSCQDVCDDIEDNGNDMGWHWSDWIFSIFWRLWPSCPGCSCHKGAINTTIWITSAFMRRVAVTLITYRCLH